MFSGIVETTAPILRTTPGEAILHAHVARPESFSDVAIGDSIACDGCCLTVDHFDARELRFALGPETLNVTGWRPDHLLGRHLNLERSLRMNDRVHGHFVTGHVDASTEVVQSERVGETLQLRLAIPERLKAFVWTKGSLALNGVSLTINDVGRESLMVWLIPETLKRTNLGRLKVGDRVNLEIDNMARGLVRWAELRERTK